MESFITGFTIKARSRSKTFPSVHSKIVSVETITIPAAQ